MRAKTYLRTLLATLMLLAAGQAFAHKVGISRGEYRADGSTLRVAITFARPEIATAISGLDANDDGTLSTTEIVTGRSLLASALINGLTVSANNESCRGEFDQAELTAYDGVAVRLHYRCAQSPLAFRVRLPLLSSLSVGHRHLAAVNSGPSAGSTASATTQVLYESSPEFEIGVQATSTSDHVAGPLFTLGIEHILTGFDLLMFLFGVILVGGRLHNLLLAVTAFTLAHSITLGFATLGFWAPSPNVVEPAIALSIVYVGVENWFVKDASKRWLLTFPFGLIHGFGFAGALREIALPKAQVPLALLSFNLGVETGQLLVLAAVVPVLYWLRRRPWFAQRGMRSASAMVALAGLVWFVQRV